MNYGFFTFSLLCMKQCSPLCNKVLGVLRIVFGLWMLWAWISKISASPEMIAGVGSAAHMLGLTFLSTTAWFWIAVVGEILAWLFLVSGCCKLTKVWAILTLVIMVFALNMLGWTTPDTIIAWLFVVVAIALLVWGRGSRCFCPFACCKGVACCEGGCCDSGMKSCACCKPGCTCGDCAACKKNTGSADVATVVWPMAANAKEMIGTATEKAESVLDSMKEKVGDIAGKADGLVDMADGMIDKAKDMLDKVDDVVVSVGWEAGKKVVDMAKGALEKADDLVEQANTMVDKADDMLDKKVEEAKK